MVSWLSFIPSPSLSTIAENELGRFMPAQFLDITPSTQVDTYTDPVYVAMAKKIVH